LAALRPTVHEIPCLEAALSALQAEGTKQRSARLAGARQAHRRASPAIRAPRGANRSALLDAVQQRPGASAAELAKVAGIKLTTARTTLSTLARTGELRRDEVGGVAGYHPAT
jgi:Fic family protein